MKGNRKRTESEMSSHSYRETTSDSRSESDSDEHAAKASKNGSPVKMYDNVTHSVPIAYSPPKRLNTKDNLISKFSSQLRNNTLREARKQQTVAMSHATRFDIFNRNRFQDEEREVARDEAREQVKNAFADESNYKLYDLVISLYEQGNEILTSAFEEFITDNKNNEAIVDRVINNVSEETLLHIAALRGNSKLVKFLLDNGANALIYDSYEMTPFDNSIQTGDLQSASLLLLAMNLFETNLIEDSVENYLTQILMQFENDGDPKELLDFYRTTFADNYLEKTDSQIYFKRSFLNDPVTELKIILDILSKTSAADDLFAAAQNDPEAKEILMRVIEGHFIEKIDEIVDENGNTFLHLAAKYNDEKLVKFLLSYKADPELNNYHRETALELNFTSENLPSGMSCADNLLRAMAINPALNIDKIAASCRNAIDRFAESSYEYADHESILRDYYQGNLAFAYALKTHKQIIPLQREEEEDLSAAFARLTPRTQPSGAKIEAGQLGYQARFPR